MKNITLKTTIIVGILVFILSFGATYALNVWSSGNTLISGTTKCFKVDYEKGQDIDFTDGLVAQTSFDKNNAVYTTLSIARNEDCDLCGTGSIKVNITSTIDLSSGALSYKIFDYNTRELATGSITNTGVTEIYKDFDITSRTSTNFIIYFYLDASKLTNDYLEASFSGKIYAEAKSNGNICNNNKDDNYCENNNITNLSECILRSEDNSDSIESAKTYIANKGTPDFNKIAPTINYVITETEKTNNNGIISTSSHFTLGKGYTFNNETGIFYLTDYNNNELSDEYLDYYTCGSTSGTWANCSTLYKIKEYTKSGTTYKVTNAIVYSYTTKTLLSSEGGLYKADDYDGNPTYYFRGDTQNNYVYYAGYYWRIVRINSDGSIRIIYDGTTPHKNGEASSDRQIGYTKYNSNYWDPTYVGYMYSENFELKENDTTTVTYYNFTESSTYYYGSSYIFDTSTKKFKLSGNTTSGVWKNVYNDVITNYPYTCFSTSVSGTCNYILKLTGYVSSYQAKVNYISYSSKDYASTLNNTTDSTIKTYIDNWYKNNILNKTDENNISYSDYLTDNIFCNDRSLSSGDGFSLSKWSAYNPYKRLITTKVPSLICSQTTDKFTTSSTTGNGKLTYPVGLITADEVYLAGGKYYNNNNRYYLYTGTTYWTGSPYDFNPSNGGARAWYVSSAGSLDAPWVAPSYGARPVVNLNSNTLLSSGAGTRNSPYQIKVT